MTKYIGILLSFHIVKMYSNNIYRMFVWNTKKNNYLCNFFRPELYCLLSASMFLLLKLTLANLFFVSSKIFSVKHDWTTNITFFHSKIDKKKKLTAENRITYRWPLGTLWLCLTKITINNKDSSHANNVCCCNNYQAFVKIYFN